MAPSKLLKCILRIFYFINSIVLRIEASLQTKAKIASEILKIENLEFFFKENFVFKFLAYVTPRVLMGSLKTVQSIWSNRLLKMTNIHRE